MDDPSIRAYDYVKKFAVLIQDGGFESYINDITWSYVSMLVTKNGVHMGSIRCYKDQDTCLIRTLTGLVAPMPFGIKQEIFVDCPILHWTMRLTAGIYYCGLCHVKLSRDSTCRSCYLQRYDLADLRSKGSLWILCKCEAFCCKCAPMLISDVIGHIVKLLAIFAAHHRLFMMKIV